jgi:hypothetical protein
MTRFETGTTVRVKKHCCHSEPRCKRCPVVWRRLARAGLAERVGGCEFRVVGRIRKKDVKLARR